MGDFDWEVEEFGGCVGCVGDAQPWKGDGESDLALGRVPRGGVLGVDVTHLEVAVDKPGCGDDGGVAKPFPSSALLELSKDALVGKVGTVRRRLSPSFPCLINKAFNFSL